MSSSSIRLRHVVAFVFVTLFTAAGCRSSGARLAPGELDAGKVPPRDDVISVNVLWPTVIWLYDADQNPVGFRAPVYFVSGETERGTFVERPIYVRIYGVKNTGGPRTDRELLHEWVFDANVHEQFRVRKRAIGGFYYGFPLKWPETAPILGREVDIVFGYKRADGAMVESMPKRDLAVPANQRRFLPPVASAPPSTTFAGEDGRAPAPGAPAATGPTAQARAANPDKPRVIIRADLK